MLGTTRVESAPREPHSLRVLERRDLPPLAPLGGAELGLLARLAPLSRPIF